MFRHPPPPHQPPRLSFPHPRKILYTTLTMVPSSFFCVVDSSLYCDQGRSVYDALFHHQTLLYYVFFHSDHEKRICEMKLTEQESASVHRLLQHKRSCDTNRQLHITVHTMDPSKCLGHVPPTKSNAHHLIIPPCSSVAIVSAATRFITVVTSLSPELVSTFASVVFFITLRHGPGFDTCAFLLIQR